MANEFKSNVGSTVSKKDAETWIDKYDKSRQDKEDTRSVFYGRDALLTLLSKEESTGITFFLALTPDEQGKDVLNLVLVSTRENGSFIWSDGSSGAATRMQEEPAYDKGTRCPPTCP